MGKMSEIDLSIKEKLEEEMDKLDIPIDEREKYIRLNYTKIRDEIFKKGIKWNEV